MYPLLIIWLVAGMLGVAWDPGIWASIFSLLALFTIFEFISREAIAAMKVRCRLEEVLGLDKLLKPRISSKVDR